LRISERRCPATPSGASYLARYGVAQYSEAAIQELARRLPAFVAHEAEPHFSIIKSGGELHQILNCLDSVSRQRSRFPAEILLDLPPRELHAIPSIQCRVANVRPLVRGRALVFLRADTRVAEVGWTNWQAALRCFPMPAA
jgi:hypothetical protein